MTREFLYGFIQQNRLSFLATVTPDHKPESACLGIAVNPELQLIFDTVSDSRKYHNLRQNRHVSFVIGWENEQTLQYEGVAEEIEKDENNPLLKLYFETFPDGMRRYKEWKNITYFLVLPIWIRFSDFNQVPPLIEEMSF